MFRIIRSIRQALAEDNKRREKLRHLFQENKKLRHVASGSVYTVVAVEPSSKVGGQACMQGPSGKLRFVSWVGPGGVFCGEVADQWDEVSL